MKNKAGFLSILQLVKEDEYIRQESNSFLKRYYNGNINFYACLLH